MPADAVRLADRSSVEGFVLAMTATMENLARVLDRETDLVAAGRLRDALAGGEAKTELAGRYLQGLGAARANAVAIARFAPHALPSLKAAQLGLTESASRNLAVLGTAKAVAEGLVKGVSDEVARLARPQGYGAAGGAAPYGGPARPMAVSRVF